MSVKAKEVADMALELVCHVTDAGTVDRNSESRYYGIAPAYITRLQSELAGCEGNPEPVPVSDLSQEVGLSDDTARKVLPSGLAMYFALADRDAAMYNHFSEIYYEKLIPSIKPGETRLKNCYLYPGDPMMR